MPYYMHLAFWLWVAIPAALFGVLAWLFFLEVAEAYRTIISWVRRFF